MALEAVVFSEGFLGCCAMAAGGGGGGGGGGERAWSWSSSHVYGGMEGTMELHAGAGVSYSATIPGFEDLDHGSSSVAALPPGHGGGRGNAGGAVVGQDLQDAAAAPAVGRRKRRRTRSVKNKEEVESQRMTHIAVERNRRKQMNEYLAVLRSLMPASYVQRGDQASIIGGAINYVKELEQLLQSLEAHRHVRPVAGDDAASATTVAVAAAPFANFFTFPQYSMSARHAPNTAAAESADVDGGNAGADAEADASGSKQSAVADIEVTIVESHANLKVLSRRRRPRQLLRMVAGLHDHRLAVLHLNVASAGHMALYSLSLKVGDDCQLTSVDDIATAVHRIIETIEQEEQRSCS